MVVKGLAGFLVFVLITALTWNDSVAFDGFTSSTKPPDLFLTVKSCNFGMTKLDHIKCGFVIVTDILISPDGVPLPFCHEHRVYKKKPDLRFIVSFGGSVVPSELFAFLTSDDKLRFAFVNNLVEYTHAHGFHGIDISWLYPSPQERDQYIRLLKDLRHACDRGGLLLTVTVPSRPSVIEVNYPVQKLDKYAHYVILSTTEFRKLRKTSFIAPLHSSSTISSNSIDYHVDRWKLAGLSCGKIVFVIQTMTLTYKLYVKNEYRVGTPALQLKIRPYYKICRKLYGGSLEIWDKNAKNPYAFRDLSWYSYENEKSIKEKVCFVVQQGLAGIAVFFYDEDDPINICGDGQYPLTATVMAAMESQFLLPSVRTDSQIYHFDLSSMNQPISQLNACQSTRPTVSSGEKNDLNEEENLHKIQIGMSADQIESSNIVSNLNDHNNAHQLIATTANTKTQKQTYPVDWFEHLIRADMSDEHYEDHKDTYLFHANGSTKVVVDNVVNMSYISLDKDITFSQKYRDSSFKISDSGQCKLFSEQSRETKNLHVIHTEPYAKGYHVSNKCPKLSSSLGKQSQEPGTNRAPGIRILATAHLATSVTTTTTSRPMPLLIRLAPKTYRPSIMFQEYKPCVANSTRGDAPFSFSPCLQKSSPTNSLGQLLAEHDIPQPTPAVKCQTCTVDNHQTTPFVTFDERVCPGDGIVGDPHDRRSYFICKRGMPMCDENKFSCAQNYIFDETMKKCVMEGIELK